MISIPKFGDDEGIIRARYTIMIHLVGLISLCPFLIDHYSIRSFAYSFPSLPAIAPGKGIPCESKISHAIVIHRVSEIWLLLITYGILPLFSTAIMMKLKSQKMVHGPLTMLLMSLSFSFAFNRVGSSINISDPEDTTIMIQFQCNLLFSLIYDIEI